MNKLVLAALACSLSSAVFAANPSVVNGVATYTSNKNIGTKFPVPNSWKKIIINSGVKITGSFFVANGSRSTNNLIIQGKDQVSSKIVGAGSHDGTGTAAAREKSAIRYFGPGTLTVKNLTSQNSVKFHVSANGKVVGDKIRLVQPDQEHTSDGFHGGQNKGSKLTNSYIDVHDDATYITETKRIENVTIVQNKNGSPFQIGWGDRNFTNDAKAIIAKTTVKSNSTTSYNQGVVSWAHNQSSVENNKVKVEIQSLTRTKASGAVHAPMYQFGTARFTANKGIIRSMGSGACSWKASIKRHNSSNSVLQTPDC